MLREAIKKAQKGFTLIEVMIAIVIIGILAAVAVPQYLKYRARSFNAQALADLRTIENQVGSYYAEWDHYPH